MTGRSEPVWLPAPEPADVAGTLTARFAEDFGGPPDGVWSAPGRVNLIGEHTDYNAGLCLPFALPHRTYAAIRVRHDDRFTMASVQAGAGWSGTLDEVGPGRPEGWSAYVAGVLWSLQRKGTRVPGLDILIDGRVPLGSGLSSSAALECSVAVAVADLAADGSTLARRDLMAASIEAENVVAGASTGGMDQAVSLLATDGYALLLDCADFSTRDVAWRIGELGWTLLVVDTRAQHALVDGQYAARRASTEEAARRLGVDALRAVDPGDLDAALARLDDDILRRRTRHVVTEIERVRVAAGALERADVDALGVAMTASHASLRDDYEVTVPELDTAVDVALGAGAAGARMTGGGFGGSAIALVRNTAYEQVAEAVHAAFADRGFAPPQFLVATPSAPAARTS